MSDDGSGDDHYKRDLLALQIELVKLQRQIIAQNEQILVLFEGRDAAGKDGTIKRIIEHLSPRETRVVALGVPSDRDKTSWYFQRFVPHLPAAQEMVLFNRSWYNRAGVERVMGFCTESEAERFLDEVGTFEHLLISSGIRLFKYYLDISKDEQRRRLDERKESPLTQWKISPIDDQAHKLWKAYSAARNEMFSRSHTPAAPWRVVRADHKKTARLNVIRDLLSHLDYDDKDASLLGADPNIVFPYQPQALEQGLIAK